MRIKNHKELRVWQDAMDLAMRIFHLTKTFPSHEKHSLIDQIRRSSRSITANISEAWRKRRYQAAFVSKLSDAESEACETQTWIELSLRCGYLKKNETDELDACCEKIMGQIASMIQSSEDWILPSVSKSPPPPLPLSPPLKVQDPQSPRLRTK
jgi:four helix bundle protein